MFYDESNSLWLYDENKTVAVNADFWDHLKCIVRHSNGGEESIIFVLKHYPSVPSTLPLSAADGTFLRNGQDGTPFVFVKTTTLEQFYGNTKGGAIRHKRKKTTIRYAYT
jgi:hypothetical protein